ELCAERLSLLFLLSRQHELDIGPHLRHASRRAHKLFLAFRRSKLTNAADYYVGSQAKYRARGVPLHRLKSRRVNPIGDRSNASEREPNTFEHRRSHAVRDGDDRSDVAEQPAIDCAAIQRKIVMTG